MTPRLRLPAYGKQLLNERRLGRHPLVVHVVYGEAMQWVTGCDLECAGGFAPEKIPDLNKPAGVPGDAHPFLWVKPSEFRPFTLDWHAVTGCAACVFDCREDVIAGSREFYELVGELGRFAGPVRVFRPAPLVAEVESRKSKVESMLKSVAEEVSAWGWEFIWQAHILACGPSWRPEAKLPSWWPPETERENVRRREIWSRAWDARPERERVAA